jgi:2,5-dihydroxypyridine 5,6-dioxygenase
MFDLSSVDLLDAFTRELELCEVKQGEHVVVLSEPGSRGDYVAAAFGAAKSLGAHVIAAAVPGGSPAPMPSTHTGAGPGLASVLNDTAAQDLLKSADLVVDLTQEGFIHAPVQQEILRAGTRIIFVCDAPDVLVRNLPSKGDKARVTAGADLLKRSETMRVTSGAGTDLTVRLDNSHPEFQVGFADDPGRWDHWPSTMVMCWPEISDGQLVLAEGDILLPFKEYVRDPVTLEIAGGHIEKVTGGAEAQLLRTFFDDAEDQWGDRWARSLSHMGWGLMKSADWFATAMYGKGDLMGMDARAFAGNFLWSTGPHPVLGRESYAHLDIAMRGCTVSVDGTDVVVSGSLIGD